MVFFFTTATIFTSALAAKYMRVAGAASTDCSVYTCSYTVASGDTLSTIATALTANGAACTWSDLCDCNALTDCNAVYPDSTIKIPCGSGATPAPVPTPTPPPSEGGEWITWTGAGITYHGPAYDVATYCPASDQKPIGNACWALDNQPTFKPTVLKPFCESDTTSHPIAFGHPAILNCGECAEIRVKRLDGSYNQIVVMTTDNPGIDNLASPELTTDGKKHLTLNTGLQLADRLPFDWRQVDCTAASTRRFELPAPKRRTSSTDCSAYTCSYTVANGDTLSTIATTLTADGAACTWSDLCDCNALTDCNSVYPGSTLKVPCGSGPATPAPVPSNSIVGYYAWTWGSGSTGPSGANAGVAFGGVINVDDAINSMNSPASGGTCWVTGGCPALVGTKYLNLGGNGADDNSIWTTTNLAEVTSDASKIPAAGYAAVIFDVEAASGSSAALIPAFQAAFQAMKSQGLTVAVTMSHSGPVTTSPASVATDLMKAFCADANLDIISPQLYSTGTETAPMYDETSNCASLGSDACTWDVFKTCNAKFAPSIVEASQYDGVKDYFQNTYGITSEGYFQWKQEM